LQVDRLWSYNFAMTLDRFLQAQEQGGSYARALAELKAGRKTGHKNDSAKNTES